MKLTNIEEVNQENNLESILQNLQKGELINIILEISEDYSDIEKRLLFKYADNKDELAASKKLIREYINNAKRSGFIDWRHVDQAVQGAEMTLEKAQEKIKSGQTESAVQLSLAVLSPVVKMLNYSDDSNGTVGDVIYSALNTVEQAVEAGIDHLNDREHKKLFDSILKEALKEYYDGWSDWRYNLLKVCTYFSAKLDLRKRLEKQLEILSQEVGKTWRSDYDQKEIKLILLQIIERNDGADKAEEYIYANIQYSDFRKNAIANESNKGDYKKVIQLCLEGEKIDRAASKPGLVTQWQELRYLAYENLGDIEKQRLLARELLFHNEFQYYEILKGLYERDEWDGVIKTIVKETEGQRVYLDIIKAEKMTSHILDYCQQHISYVIDLYPYLIEDYLNEVNQLFVKYIEEEASEASDRRGYKNVCKIIKTYKNACGIIHSHKIIGELKQKYPRRPALLDELGKIK